MNEDKTEKRKRGAKPGMPSNNKIHGLAGLMADYYKNDIEKVIEAGRLPVQMQRFINKRMRVFRRQLTFNEVTEGLFKRLAFKEAWCTLAEQWFVSQKLSAFWIRDDGQFSGSYLAMQHKIFSESIARDYEKLDLLPRKNKFKGMSELAKAITELENEE